MKRNGLTLVEVSLTVVLASIVAMAVYSTLSYGLRIWQKSQAGLPEEDAAIFFSKFNDELENAINYPGMEFSGNETSVAIPTIIFDKLSYAQSGQGPGLVRYLFDETEGELLKSAYSIVDIYQGSKIQGSPQISNVTTVRFSYYFLDSQTKEYSWSSDWPPQEATVENLEFPLAVRAALYYFRGNKKYEYNQTVFLPLARQ